jgi:hypothetical protein
MPDCTLGTRISGAKSDEAVAFARSFDRSITVLFDIVDCAVFPPVQVVAAGRSVSARGLSWPKREMLIGVDRK